MPRGSVAFTTSPQRLRGQRHPPLPPSTNPLCRVDAPRLCGCACPSVVICAVDVRRVLVVHRPELHPLVRLRNEQQRASFRPWVTFLDLFCSAEPPAARGPDVHSGMLLPARMY